MTPHDYNLKNRKNHVIIPLMEKADAEKINRYE